jgi:uncharacterized phage-associated protein
MGKRIPGGKIMCSHFIILSSSYSAGERIALDFTDISEERAQYIDSVIKEIKQQCGEDVSISTHGVNADGSSWESVQKADPFFQEVRLIKNVDEFIETIKKDRSLTGLDVAKYILSLVECTHLKLEKLVYLCYADYLCATGKRLFEDKIFAYKFGPVIDSVYKKYKFYGKDNIDEEEVMPKRKYSRSARSRILFSEKGILKASSIIMTLQKYGSLDANALVTLTHKNSAPWTHYDSSLSDQEMKDDIIRKYHSFETI